MLMMYMFILIFSNALTIRKEIAYYYARLSIIALINCTLILHSANYILNLYKGVSLYGGVINITSLTQTFTEFIIVITCMILSFNCFYPLIITSNIPSYLSSIKASFNKKTNTNLILLGDKENYFYKLIEYPLIIIFVVSGGNFLMCSGDLVCLFISIELQSYALYILSSIHRESEQSTWGGLTYFLLGGLSSCFILLGSALIYINTGTTSLEGIYIITAISELYNSNIENLTLYSNEIYHTNYIDISLILICAGLLFKISAAPFHFWSPDVYDSLPTTVTTYVAIIAKISLLVFLLDLVFYINIDSLSVSWKTCLLISSMLSLIIGCLQGLTQYRIKRVFAYSTISHIGFILLALCVNNTESIQAYVFYIISYTITNLNVFILIVSIGYIYQIFAFTKDNVNNKQERVDISDWEKYYGKIVDNKNQRSPSGSLSFAEKPISNIYLYDLASNYLKDINNSPLQLIYQVKGFFFFNSYLCISLTITLFSLIGIPPLIGFFAKQMVLSAALDNGYVFISLIAILTSVISAVYYLNIVKHMFFFHPDSNPFIKQCSSNNNIFKKYLNGYMSSLYPSSDLNPNNIKTTNNTVYNFNNLSINSALSINISILSLLIALFILSPDILFNLVKLLSLFLFK